MYTHVNQRMRTILFPSIGALLFSAAFILSLASGAQMLSIDSDLGRHLTLGNYILDHRVIPTGNLFSHTLTGQSRPPYEWLSQVMFAVSYRLLGLDGVILLTAIIISVSIFVVYQHSIRRSGSPLVALLVLLLVVASSSIHWLPRPHIVTYIVLAIWINKLEQVRRNEKTVLYVFPLLMLFWANLHGGFIFGFLALAAYFAGWLWDRRQNRSTGETGKKYLLIGLISLGASILTPDLWRNWEAVLNNRSAFILSRTAETMPPDFTDPSTAPFAILLALTVVFPLANRKAISAAHLFLLSGLGALSLLMARNIPLFSIACAPLLAEWISAKANQLPAWKKLDTRFINLSTSSKPFLFPLIVTILAIGFFAYRHSEGRQTYQFNPQIFPVRAADWLEQNPMQGNMFNEVNWGGYLLYRLWPRDLVFTDSQSDFYGEPLMRDYETILLAQNNWRDLLEKYAINWVIVPARSPLAAALISDSNWVTNYQDSAAVIIQRK